MLVELFRFVVRCLQYGGTSHGRLGGGDDGKVLARDSQKYLPKSVRSLSVHVQVRSIGYRYVHVDV